MNIASKVAKTAPIAQFTSCEVTLPPLNEGERWVGAIISADGSKREHIILLPGEIGSANWNDAIAWAASIGGELPDRCEGALLFATMKDEFEPAWHWTREQHAADSDYAWYQDFNYGTQYDSYKNHELRARAVRRLEIL